MEAMQIQLWRQATPLRKMEMLAQLNASARTLALMGLRSRYPQAGEAELRRESMFKVCSFPGHGPLSNPNLPAPKDKSGSLGFAVVNARFWGVSGVYTQLTPQNLGTSPPIPKEPQIFSDETELSANFASPEDTILAKLEWHRMGGEVSDRQWRDILGVLKTRAGELDLTYLHTWAKELKVNDLLERILKEAA